MAEMRTRIMTIVNAANDDGDGTGHVDGYDGGDDVDDDDDNHDEEGDDSLAPTGCP